MDSVQLSRQQLRKRFLTIRKVEELTPPTHGWVRAIRDALGMTTRQLARRMGVSQPRITALEKAEARGVVSLQSLRRAAEAMECELVYALVPKKNFEDIIQKQAEKKTALLFKELYHTMLLENQIIDPEQQKQNMLADLLLSERSLWDE